MPQYNVIATTPESTIVADYVPLTDGVERFQSEAELENQFIKDLLSQGYQRLSVKSEAELIANLRQKIEELNHYHFTDTEWKQFFNERLANENEGILEKTRKIQQDYIQSFRGEDGITRNIYLIDKKQIHNNQLQVLNQYVQEEGSYQNRYDVTILVNGFPLVHVELKRRGVNIREAFNQIDRYQRDSFWAGSGLFQYVQIFVISNGTMTKYYSNTTRERHIKELGPSRGKSAKTSNSFEFTSYWADANNKVISDLRDFTRTFFSRHSLLNVITKFCVFTEEQSLLVMRPYQICATEQILQRINIAYNQKWYGTVKGGGYIWHTTGSGKTLTSFKTAQLATQLDYIDKVLFVVDRNDLDYQTQREYDRFQKGAANASTSTRELEAKLSDPMSRIIITTIQKLSNFVKRNPSHPAFKQHLVMIFDECHRSQFGDMHKLIVKHFKAYYLFGFTGTPIFAANATLQGDPSQRTTEQVFGLKLHSYTIIDAIRDGNVLPFKVDYVETVKSKQDIDDEKVPAIDTEEVLLSPKRINAIVTYILDHMNQKTMRNNAYDLHGQRVFGFNSMLAVASVPAAKIYYQAFKEQLAKRALGLKIATIFTFAVNEEDPQHRIGTLDDEPQDTSGLDQSSRDFLEGAIADYNAMFGTNYDTSSDKFPNYYKDVSRRMKNRELDMLIVVNMFLTGFDATTLNTLWVDKNLKMHGLIQAFSRTNRILNSVKTHGNIVCFRNLSKALDDALALFGNKNAHGLVVLKTFKDYFNGYLNDKNEKVEGYAEKIERLLATFPLGVPLNDEEAEKAFIRLFGEILHLRNILLSFDEFEGQDPLPDRVRQDYQSVYLNLNDKYRKLKNTEKESVLDDVVFELELVRQDEINIHYILELIQKNLHLLKDKDITGVIYSYIDSSPDLRPKKELIERFLTKLNAQHSNVNEEWSTFIDGDMETALMTIINEERLKPQETRTLMFNALRDEEMPTTGVALDNILPPLGLFDNSRSDKLKVVLERLKAFFNLYLGIGKLKEQ